MLGIVDWSWRLDGWIIVVGVLCAMSSALLGTFLVLRRMSLLGDAISHAVLPGLAAAFLISSSRSSWWMFVGAVVVGVLTALLSDFIHRRGRVDEGASMGVVFTTLFAAGLVMIVMAADQVDLDPGCVLYGAIEQTPLDMWTVSVSDQVSWRMPRVVWILSAVAAMNAAFVIVFFKELKISTFDPDLAGSSGLSPAAIHYMLMTLVAITAVASFECVGNILVVAMLVVPPATAYLLTERLGILILLACAIGTISAIAGHLAAVELPTWFGYRSTTTAGMMAVATGASFASAFMFAPRNGVAPRLARRWWLSWSILADDVLSLLYRIEERPGKPRNVSSIGRRGSQTAGEADAIDWIAETLLTSRWATTWTLRFHAWRGNVTRPLDGQLPQLTDSGRTDARSLVRSHRLWEQYLVTRGDASEKSIHDIAHRLEHFTDSKLAAELDSQTDSPETDPHGSPIPKPDPGEDFSSK
ncbi:MAG: iron chelate uptake ABC transporter family permease subunit [Planctomycetota bacterium]